ncbi:hypothetical protein PV326_013587, partial [Microctonus aethiopoides]
GVNNVRSSERCAAWPLNLCRGDGTDERMNVKRENATLREWEATKVGERLGEEKWCASGPKRKGRKQKQKEKMEMEEEQLRN